MRSRIYLLGIALLLCCTATEAWPAIIYSGVLNQTATSFSIDINNDSTADFVAGWSTWAEFPDNPDALWRGFDTEIVSGMEFLYFEQDGVPVYKVPLPPGCSVGPQAPAGMVWDTGQSYPMLMDESPTGYASDIVHLSFLNGTGNKYIGFQLQVGSSYYYGWIRLHVDAANNVRLIDYAYESTPDTPVKIPNPTLASDLLLLYLD